MRVRWFRAHRLWHAVALIDGYESTGAVCFRRVRVPRDPESLPPGPEVAGVEGVCKQCSVQARHLLRMFRKPYASPHGTPTDTNG